MRSSRFVSTGFFYLAVALVFAASFGLPLSANESGGGGGGTNVFCPTNQDCTTSCNGGHDPSPCTGSCGLIWTCGCFSNNSNGNVTCSCQCN
jgi:uncharacterized membrane protein